MVCAYYVLIVLRKPHYKPKGIVMQTVLTGFFHKDISCHFCIAAGFSDLFNFLATLPKAGEPNKKNDLIGSRSRRKSE